MGLFDKEGEAELINQLRSDVYEIIDEVKAQKKIISRLLEDKTKNRLDIRELISENSVLEKRLIALEAKLEVIGNKNKVDIHNVSGNVEGDMNVAGGDQK